VSGLRTRQPSSLTADRTGRERERERDAGIADNVSGVDRRQVQMAYGTGKKSPRYSTVVLEMAIKTVAVAVAAADCEIRMNVR